MSAAETIQALVSRVIEQEVSIGVLRGYVAILVSEAAQRSGMTEATAADARAEIAGVEQRTLAETLANLEDRDPTLAALLDRRNVGDVPTD